MPYPLSVPASRTGPRRRASPPCAEESSPPSHRQQQRADASGRPYLGAPTVFVSHAWRYALETPLSVMLDYAEANPDAYFW